MNERILLTLVLTAGLASAYNVMPEGEDFPKNIDVNFDQFHFDLFKKNLKAGHSLKEYFKEFYDFLDEIQDVNFQFNTEMHGMLIVFHDLINRLTSGEKDYCLSRNINVTSGYIIVPKREQLTDRVLKFKRNSISWSLAFDTAINWIEKRVEMYPEGKTRDKLVFVHKNFLEAKNSLLKIAILLEKVINQLNTYDPYIVCDPFELIHVIHVLKEPFTYNFLDITDQAVKTIDALVKEPESTLVSTFVGALNILPYTS